MHSSASLSRYEHFKRHHLSWLVVRHFVSAPLMQELSAAVVDVASASQFQLEDLFEIELSSGSAPLVSWGIWPKTVDRGLASYLQRFVRSIVWQNDDPPIVNPELDGNAAVRDLVSAASLSFLHSEGLASDADTIAEELKPLARALLLLRRAAPPLDPIAEIVREVGAVDAPLGALLLKHLGDSCAYRDEWERASEFYSSSEMLLTREIPSCWEELIRAVQTMITQSRASAARALSGPEEAGNILETVRLKAEAGADWLARINAPADLFDARINAAVVTFSQDAWASTLFGPQLLHTHRLSAGFERWAEKKYDDAYQRFWAVLKRQLALGSVVFSQQTKGHFGVCIIDGIAADLERARNEENFQLGVRLLIESGSPTTADRAPWSDPLVATYVDASQVETATTYAWRTPGFREQRVLVLLGLFKKWLEVLHPDREQVAQAMLSFVARSAAEGGWSAYKQRNVAGASFEVLQSIAKSRPEFRHLATTEVGTAITSGLASQSPLQIRAVLETATLYADALNSASLRDIINVTLQRVEAFGADQGAWLIQPALIFLDQARRQFVGDEDRELRRTVVAAMLSISVANNEGTMLMWLLRDLEPTEIEERLDRNRLDAIVEGLGQHAMKTNSTGAAANISALLATPSIAGPEGIRTALAGLLATLKSAEAGRPAISFDDAYHSLLMLTENITQLNRILGAEGPGFSGVVDEILEALLKIWRRAEKEPLIFRGFAIPFPTTPNRTIVHNWAFASLAFGRRLQRAQDVDRALDSASRNSMLEAPISVARAVETPVNDPALLDVEKIAAEKRDAFYASLGQRLVVLQGLSESNRRTITATMLNQCYRLGPRGEDAAVFAAALAVELAAAPSGEAEAYRRRLENERALRLTLSPLWERLNRSL